MPTLKHYVSEGSPKLYSIHKPMTTIGKAPGNDLVITGPRVLPSHAQISFDGRDFIIQEIEKVGALTINGKKKRRARLVHGDRIKIDETEIGFSIYAEALKRVRKASSPSSTAATTVLGAHEVAGVRKLFDFSEKLMRIRDLDELLETLLDDVIELTHAQKGFVLLVDSDLRAAAAPPAKDGSQHRWTVRASRNVGKTSIADAEGGISDSIVQEVVNAGKPLIVSDAVADTTFGKSESVIAMQLSSVLCAPMMAQGEVIGALYVGNDKVKELFRRPQLDLLSIFAAQASLILQNAMLLAALREDKAKLENELRDKRFGEIVGACDSMREVFRKLEKVAGTDISVLITGETGTGKELVAHEIHRRSPRAKGPFVTINCGAIPENLIESELFGHVKGAFTGAVMNRPGKFHLANSGTLFLDEVGELPLNLQVKLLRALQERVVMRVGSSKPEKVDIRVVAATNRVLEEMVKDGSFREDLFYRLNVVNLWLPPLRDRGDDVLIIAKMFLSKYAEELGSAVRGYSPAAIAAIRKYGWPGNVRQLQNRIKKGLVLCEQTLLDAEDLDLGAAQSMDIMPLEKAKEEFQRRYVLEVLERNAGNRTQTARDLGVDPRTIFRYLEKEPHPVPPK
ncbi:MAG: sigma 54-interacting transcriptional regulator [Deltaproteobacteria bacterium]|jgi:transcriptional regulator with GAF, ATPase, and Fis domain|nr:sigma 54-interacting transcriptional regulator [Deltaproteobacteria bacterium]MBW2529995.1 sigma 54-interacting transcriptional regulator [Deltaproteobacteria bacterium]